MGISQNAENAYLWLQEFLEYIERSKGHPGMTYVYQV